MLNISLKAIKPKEKRHEVDTYFSFLRINTAIDNLNWIVATDANAYIAAVVSALERTLPVRSTFDAIVYKPPDDASLRAI